MIINLTHGCLVSSLQSHSFVFAAIRSGEGTYHPSMWRWTPEPHVNSLSPDSGHRFHL